MSPIARDKGKGKKKFFAAGAVARNAARQQQRGSQYGHLLLPKGVRIFQEEPSTRVALDIMPYEVTELNHPDRDDEFNVATPGNLWYKRPYWLHRGVGPSNESVVCPTSVKRKCPICEERARMLKEGADWADDAVKSLKPSLRNLYVVIPRGHRKYNEEPHIWSISQFLFQDKLNEEISENEEYESFPDLEDGRTLKIRFGEDSMGPNKFATTSRIDFVERDAPYSEDILKQIPLLDDVLQVPSTKEVEALFFGAGVVVEEDDEETDDDEDDEEQTPRQERRRATPRVSDLTEGAEDEEENDAFPSRTRRSVAQAPAPEAKSSNSHKDDDGNDEEEMPEEAPSVKRGRASTSKAPAPRGKVIEADKEEEVQSRSKAAGKKGATKARRECPSEHVFGQDCDEFDDCDECPMWEECSLA